MTEKTDNVERLDRTKSPPKYEAALAAVWAHYEREHDPPGMQVHAWGYGRREAEQPWWRARASANLAESRAAAWAWYWRRVALADALAMITMSSSAGVRTPFWPRCLAWSDEQVAEVDHWIAEGGGAPEVLRG